ncbi:hypothetical protein BGX29_010503 [Mortierella sp. GBA35]|nr:hypothetical protein BGX29_010503 [Mortierella sp. GBA35]
MLRPIGQRFVNLEELSIWDKDEGSSEENHISIIKACPNVGDLNLPHINLESETVKLAQVIGELCPNLWRIWSTRLQAGGYKHVPFRIMEYLPAQQLKQCIFISSTFPLDDLTARNTILCHSSTLRSLNLLGCSGITDKALQPILVECRVLETLQIRWGRVTTALSLPWPTQWRNYGLAPE